MKQRFYMLWSACGISLCLVTVTSTVIFGENAKLEVGGSFVATTANAIRFGNQGFFRASASEVPLLTVNPSALFYQSANNPTLIESENDFMQEGKALLIADGGAMNPPPPVEPKFPRH